ncbi:MAG: hypothetical protein AAB510_00395 [Patescibacteria group bacterium]
MPKIIPIITSAPIKYAFDGLDTYDAFDLVSQGIKEAPLSENVLEIIKNHKFSFPLKGIKIIFTAEKGQTVETAKLFIDSGITPNAKIVRTYLLNGINFSMRNLISKEKFVSMPQGQALSLAREAFVIELYKNNLEESLGSIISQMNSLLSLLKDQKGSVLCISHSFYIKLFEIYIKDRSRFLDVEILIDSFNPEHKPYEPLSGFILEI